VGSVEGFTVAISVVCFNPDGSYRVYSGETEFRLPVYSFVVAFSGSCIEYWDTPSRVSGYVAPYGFYPKRSDPLYLRMYPICRVHYRRILRRIEDDCKIEDLVEVLRSR